MKPMFTDPGAVAMLTALGVPNDHRLTDIVAEGTHTGRMVPAMWAPDTAKQAEGRLFRSPSEIDPDVRVQEVCYTAQLDNIAKHHAAQVSDFIREWVSKCNLPARPPITGNDLPPCIFPVVNGLVGANDVITHVDLDDAVTVDRLFVRTRQNVTYVVEQTVNGDDYQVLMTFRGRTGRKRARQWLRSLAWAPYVLTTINVDFHRNQPVDHIHINCTVVPKETTE